MASSSSWLFGPCMNTVLCVISCLTRIVDSPLASLVFEIKGLSLSGSMKTSTQWPLVNVSFAIYVQSTFPLQRGRSALGRTKMHMHPAGRIEGNVCKREAGQDWSLDQLLHT